MLGGEFISYSWLQVHISFACIFHMHLGNAFSLRAIKMWVFMVPWGSGIISVTSLSLGGFFFLVNLAKRWLHSVLYFLYTYKNNRLATNVVMINQREKELLFSLSISSSFSKKQKMGRSVIGDNLLGMKSDFTLVMSIFLNSDTNLKSKNGLDRLINGSDLYLYRVMGTLDVKEFTVGIIVLLSL